jgi:hypothetical protein
MMPLSMRGRKLRKPMYPHALAVQNSAHGTPISLAASTLKLIRLSATTHVTLCSSASRARKWAGQLCLVAWLMVGGSCVASASDAGRPSEMVANRKSGRPATAPAPRERTRRRWLYSVLTKVMRKLLLWRILASFIIGVMWPCAGNGRHTACGFSPAGTAEAFNPLISARPAFVSNSPTDAASIAERACDSRRGPKQ